MPSLTQNLDRCPGPRQTNPDRRTPTDETPSRSGFSWTDGIAVSKKTVATMVNITDKIKEYTARLRAGIRREADALAG